MKRALGQAVLWGLYCAFSLMWVHVYDVPFTSGIVAIMLSVSGGLWLATEGLRALALRRRWLDLAPWALVVRILVWPPLAAVATQLAVYGLVSLLIALHAVTMPPPDRHQGWGAFAGYTINTAIMLWLWLGAWGAARYLARWREGEIERWRAEAARRALELDVLRAQVNPHFLFNALNNLRALISEDPARARDMVTRLSNILRHTLQHSARELVPLVDELALVRDYVALEQLHYEERLRVDWRIAPGAEAAQVPPMALQLLVENAIKHGIARAPAGGTVDVEIVRDAGRLRVSVGNPGRWEPGPRAGIGLAHLRERLARAGGPGAECHVSEDAGRVRVSLVLAS
jgi:signal transduction histidine kinase